MHLQIQVYVSRHEPRRINIHIYRFQYFRFRAHISGILFSEQIPGPSGMKDGGAFSYFERYVYIYIDIPGF